MPSLYATSPVNSGHGPPAVLSLVEGTPTVFQAHRSGTAFASGSTYFLRPGGRLSFSTTESQVNYTVRGATIKFAKLVTRFTANTASGGTSTLSSRNNGVDGNLLISIPASTSGTFTDDAGADTVSDGQTFGWKLIPASGGSLTGQYVNCTSTPVNVTSQKVSQQIFVYTNGGNALQTFNNASSTTFHAIDGNASENASTEAQQQVKIYSEASFKGLQIYAHANARTTTTTIRFRKNTTNGNLAVSIGAAATGKLEDITNADGVLPNDLICYAVETGTGTEALTMGMFSVYRKGVDANGIAISASSVAAGPTNANAYGAYSIENMIAGGADAAVSSRPKTSITISNLSIYLATNGITATSTFQFRKNAAATAISISITASTTGLFENVTDTDTAAADDLINTACTAGATGTSLSYFSIAFQTTALAVANNVERALVTEIITVSEASLARLAAKLRAPTTETITIGGDISTRLTAKIRVIATQTTSIGESINRLAAKLKPIATQTTTLSENVIRVKGKVKTLATETITVTGGTLARLLAKIRTRSETVVIGETRARLAAKNRTLATQTVITGENLARIKGILRTLATQTVIVTGGTLARLSVKIRALAAQTIALTEDLQRTITAGAQNIVKTITQTVTLGESITRIKGSQRTTIQTITVGAGSIARLNAKIRSAVPQTIVIADARARLKTSMRSLATQTTTIGAGGLVRIKAAQRTISQTILLTDNRNRLAAKFRVLSLQTVVIADSVARQIIGGPVEIIRALSETVVLSHSVARLLSAQRALSAETVPKAENLVRIKGKVRLISQTIAISEQATRIKSSLRLLLETVPTSQNLARINALRRTVIQTIFLAENVAQETVGNLARALVETITISDSIVRRTAKLMILNQTIAIAEQANRISIKLRAIPIQSIATSDLAIAEVNVIIKNVIRTVGDLVGLTEHLQAFVIKVRDRFRYIREPSQKRILSNHPAWLLGTRGMHDNFEEFDG